MDGVQYHVLQVWDMIHLGKIGPWRHHQLEIYTVLIAIFDIYVNTIVMCSNIMLHCQMTSDSVFEQNFAIIQGLTDFLFFDLIAFRVEAMLRPSQP